MDDKKQPRDQQESAANNCNQNQAEEKEGSGEHKLKDNQNNVGGQNQNNISVANVSNEAAYGVNGNCSFDQLIGVTSSEMNMFDECSPHSSEKKNIEIDLPFQQNQDLSFSEEGNLLEKPRISCPWHKDKEGLEDAGYSNQSEKSPSQNQEGILNLNSDIFEYCCFHGNVGDDVLMLYPAQNHFIEEYDPDDQYEIQDHFVTDMSSQQNEETSQKTQQESNSPQSANIVNQMSNLNLSGCATTDLSHKSSKNALNQQQKKINEMQQFQKNQQSQQAAQQASNNQAQMKAKAQQVLQNQQEAQQSYETGNVEVLYGTGQQISMFDQLTENDGDAEDGAAVVVPQGLMYHQNYGESALMMDGQMPIGGLPNQWVLGSGGNLEFENFDGIDEFELLTGAIMFDGQFGPKKIKKMQKLHQNYYSKGNRKRIHTDPGYQYGHCLGESDVDLGEDLGEEGPCSTSNYYRVNKNFRNLHKYRERIQVLNEDLNVLIFDGEEEFDQISEQILSKQKLLDQFSMTNNNQPDQVHIDLFLNPSSKCVENRGLKEEPGDPDQEDQESQPVMQNNKNVLQEQQNDADTCNTINQHNQ